MRCAAAVALVLGLSVGMGTGPPPAGADPAAVVVALTGAELPPPTGSPEAVRRQADEVLSRPEFQRPEPNVVERAQSWAQERLARLFESLIAGNGASVIGWLIIIGALSAIGYLVLRFSRSVQADPRQDLGAAVARTRSTQDWEEEAARHEQAEEWKFALRCRFRALVTALVAVGRVDDVPGRTAGEYRGEVAQGLPDAADRFAEATRLFEAAWYGNQATGRDENERFRTLADEVVDIGRRSARRTGVATPAPADAVTL